MMPELRARRPRLALLFVAAAAMPALVTVVLLAWVSYRQTASVARVMTHDRLVDYHYRVSDHVRTLFGAPHYLTQLNMLKIRRAELPLGDVASWRSTLFSQLELIPGVAAVAWGDEEGRAIWLGRRSGETTLVMGLKAAPSAGNIEERELDARGVPARSIGTAPYDPRERPWYRAAADLKEPSWSTPWVWSSTTAAVPPTLAVSYSVPVLADDGKLIGVVDAEITLAELSRFLASVVGASQTVCFVVDKSGYLLASSANTGVTDTNGNPILASASTDPLVARAVIVPEGQDSFSQRADGGPDATPPHDARAAGSVVRANAADTVSLAIDLPTGPHRVIRSTMRGPDGLEFYLYTALNERLIVRGAEQAARLTFVYGVVAVILAGLVGAVFGTLLVMPIRAVIAHVRRIAAGDYRARLQLSSTPELVQLASELNHMSVALEDRAAMRRSLLLAQDVQQALLPSETPRVAGLEVATHVDYCDETGGDYLDFFSFAGSTATTLNVAVGDISGHGIPAALLMASARGLLRAHCDHVSSLHDLLSHVNRHLVRDLSEGRFMTLLLTSIDSAAGEMRWASAGHDNPIVYDPQSDSFLNLNSGGIPLGIDADADFPQDPSVSLRPGQVIVLATDGVWELYDPSGKKMFGRERLHESLRQLAPLHAADIVNGLRSRLAEFAGNARPTDDITFVVIKVI